MAYATYTKLRDGSWGIRAEGPVKEGAAITVKTKAGAVKEERVAKILWSGKGVHLCAIVPKGMVYSPDKFNGYGARKGGYVKACVSGGNCSSFGSGKSCGGHDCDGW